ncbi:hypothetical protein ACFQS3_15735 [Glycomyces mayteni]|uniref:Uncharacterized protein n=1 Tax=Glycomyces mayteni TaxID=543887 RepID=A0ABW2DCQ2_9ACTN|nr:hypothetical protein GCM10025732_17220 [Glycomyces mayteni]
MAKVGWLVRGRGSEQVIITAPDAGPGVREAVERLAEALDGFPGRKPAWFRVLERVGYWWYLVCMVATAAVFAVWGANGLALNLVYGFFSGVTVAVVTGVVLTGAAHLQTRIGGGKSAEQVRREVAALARPGGGVAERVEAVLAKDPSLERRVHLLAWDAAEIHGVERSAADDELTDLWELADPAAAAELDEEMRRIREIAARLDKRKKDKR